LSWFSCVCARAQNGNQYYTTIRKYDFKKLKDSTQTLNYQAGCVRHTMLYIGTLR
jgi:hypothetical protein